LHYRTLFQVVDFYLQKFKKNQDLITLKSNKPSVNIIGSVSLGFHNQHDLAELKMLFQDLGIEVNLVIPEGISVYDLSRIPQAWFNFVPYKEIGILTAEYLQENYDMPFVDIIPMGILQI